ncbi:MAG: ABC transporter permease [Xanthomonadaceae bacterium]|nr:ABC transporter permease [Xanthomonadaceae bacterium]
MSRAAANWTGLVTIVRREMRRVLRIWPQTLLPPVITMTLYFIIFGALIGRRIGEMGGYDYMQYIAPGLIIMAVLTNSYANVSSSFFGAKFGKFIEELLVSPMPNSLILLGYVAGGVLRGTLIGALVTVVAMFFTPLTVANPLLMILVVVLTAVVFALGGFINGVYANKFDDISIVPTFVLAPLTYLGGVFYTVDLLPDIARQLSLANPILYMVNAFRYAMLGVSDVHIGVALSMTVGFLVFLFALAMWLLNKGYGLRS